MKFSIIIFILKLLLIVNVVNVVSSSEVKCNPNELVLECEQEKLKLQSEISNLKLENLKLREKNQILLNERINCTEFSDSVYSISSSIQNIQEDLEPLKNSVKERFHLNRNNTEINQPKTNIENLTAVFSQVVSESLKSLLRELKPNNRRQLKRIQNCAEADKVGVFELHIPNSNLMPFEVFCNENNWLTILRRIDGSVDFERSWQDYKLGFGNVAGNIFIGLEYLYQLTAYQCNELMVILKDFDDVVKYAQYDGFRIGSEAEDYSLNVLGKCSGTANDAFRDSESMKFSTFDRDNDNSSRQCARLFKGGWWHNNCGSSKLTGVYQPYELDNDLIALEWQSLGRTKSFKYAKMMIRPISCELWNKN